MRRKKTQKRKEVEELREDHPIVYPTCLMGIVSASLSTQSRYNSDLLRAASRSCYFCFSA